jgi:hypothetical protein
VAIQERFRDVLGVPDEATNFMDSKNALFSLNPEHRGPGLFVVLQVSRTRHTGFLSSAQITIPRRPRDPRPIKGSNRTYASSSYPWKATPNLHAAVRLLL